MVLLCNQVCELSIINISVESRALLSCHDLKKIKRNKRVHIDLMDSDNFTHRKYEAQKLLRVDEHSLGHRCN